MDGCSHTSGKACQRIARNKYKIIKKAFKPMIRRQKTEGWIPGKILAGMACEGPARTRTRQDPATLSPLQRSDQPVI
jgi:hypothetical protein